MIHLRLGGRESDEVEMLSDACSEFLHSVEKSAGILAKAVHHYSVPDGPFAYGAEIDALRRACAAVKERPYDAEAAAELLRLAASVMTFHDTPPETPEHLDRQAEMKKLIRLLQDNLDGNDAVIVSAVVKNAVVETRFSQQAAERLKGLLPKLGKSAYDLAIKIISDIGSATVKKILGL
jgi:hypothetical protein